MRGRVLTLLASRKALFIQLGLFALILALVVTDIALVHRHLPCPAYRRWSAAIEPLSPALPILAGFLWFFRMVGLLCLRRFRAAWIAFGILVLEAAVLFGAIWLMLDTGLFYCAFENVELPPCLLGCPH
jgi:hypothetical protein